MSAYEKISQQIVVLDFINHPNCLMMFEKILRGQLLKTVLPFDLQFLYEIWGQLDSLETEVKHCIEMIDNSRQ